MTLGERLIHEDRIVQEIKAIISFGRAVFEPTKVFSEPMPEAVFYASSPVTTGRRLFEAMVANPPVDDAAKARLSSEVMKANIADGGAFSHWLRAQGYKMVVVPGDFFAKGWAQQHYMAFWEQVIVRYADIICFNTDWQLSNGCVEEYFIGLQYKKSMMTREPFAVMPPKADVSKQIRAAIDELDRLGGDPNKIYDLYRRIELYTERVVVDLAT